MKWALGLGHLGTGALGVERQREWRHSSVRTSCFFILSLLMKDFDLPGQGQTSTGRIPWSAGEGGGKQVRWGDRRQVYYIDSGI